MVIFWLCNNSKNMNKIHFMYVPFTGLGLFGGYRGDKWLKRRIKVFNEYTLKSLTAQKKKEFIIWVSWRLEERNNPIVQEFVGNCEKIRGMRFVHTFHGLCFWDDKYNDDIALQRLTDALTETLPELKEYIPNDTDLVYMTIQPSDDMYMNYVVEKIQKYENVGVIGWKNGYLMDYAKKEVAEYNCKTSPPFATHIFTPSIFLDPLKHQKFTGPYKSHEYVGFTEPLFEDRGFVVGVHGENVSTVYNHPWRGKILDNAEAESVMAATDTYFSEPILFPDSLRLKVRKWLNKMPLNDKLREVYHKLPGGLQKF